MSYEVLCSELKYDGKIMEVYSDKLMMPNGSVATREYVVRGGGAAAIIPVDGEGNLILVKQYRHPVKDFTIEIPAGMMEEGEDPKECAYRELEEEIGFKCEGLKYITSMHSAVGICTEEIFIYLAEELVPGQQHFDPDEFIELFTCTLDEAIQMVFDGRITDSKTMVGILAYKEILEKRKK